MVSVDDVFFLLCVSIPDHRMDEISFYVPPLRALSDDARLTSI